MAPTEPRPLFYELDAYGRAVPVDNPGIWEWERVAIWEGDDVTVSTVFLAIDHARSGPPMVFETMVFGGDRDGLQERCSTWVEAVAMHDRIVAVVTARDG
jgi:hypothetical protein